MNLKGYITKKDAARIVHDFLRQEMKEPDETDGSAAYILQDLFDCHVCAGHIIQVYVKGIMDGVLLPNGRMIFDADAVISEEELLIILTRVFFPEFRIKRFVQGSQSQTATMPEEISFEHARKLLQEKERVLLVDVRAERNYEEAHLENAVNVPLLSVIKNPYIFSESRNKMILLYCNEGYQSKAAAQCLLEAGYSKTAYFAWKQGIRI